MGKKKKGAVCNNPVAMARASGPAPISGPTIRDYLGRDRPSLEEAAGIIAAQYRKKECGSLAAYEDQLNDNYRKELKRRREHLLGSSSAKSSHHRSRSRDKKAKKKKKKSKKEKHKKSRYRSRSRSRSPAPSSSSDDEIAARKQPVAPLVSVSSPDEVSPSSSSITTTIADQTKTSQ